MRPPPPAALALLCLTSSACRGPEARLPPAYQTLAVPEDRLRSSEARDHGRALYAQHCALCHGTHADGRGIRREGLSTSPRDFTSAAWQRQVTPRTIFFVIREGVTGTAMPGWKSLDESEAWDLVAFLLSVGEPRKTTTKQERPGLPFAEKFSSCAPGTC